MLIKVHSPFSKKINKMKRVGPAVHPIRTLGYTCIFFCFVLILEQVLIVSSITVSWFFTGNFLEFTLKSQTYNLKLHLPVGPCQFPLLQLQLCRMFSPLTVIFREHGKFRENSEARRKYLCALFCFWSELHSVGDVCCRVVCLLSNVMELDGIWLVVIKAPKNTFKKLNSIFSSKKSWPGYSR